jgi:hypothetical protein
MNITTSVNYVVQTGGTPQSSISRSGLEPEISLKVPGCRGCKIPGVEAGFENGNLSHPSGCISSVVMLGKAPL